MPQNQEAHRWLSEDILTDGPIQNIAYYLGQPGYGPSRLTTAVIDKGGQVFNIKAYGAGGVGGNDAAALTAAVAAAVAAGGGIVIAPAGDFGLNSNVTIPQGVQLQCAGNDMNTPATRFKCLAAGAGLTFTGSGGIHSGFLIDGNSTATLPFTRNTGTAQGTFIAISVVSSAQDNIYLGQTQNDVFVSLTTQYAARDNIYMDNGAGGTRFIGCEINGATRYNVHLDDLISGGGAPSNVDDVTFYHAIIENIGVAGAAGVYMAGGADAIFQDCEWAMGGASDVSFHVANGTATLSGGHMLGGNTDTAIKIDSGGDMIVTGFLGLIGFGTGFNLNGGAVQLVGSINWNNVTNRYNSVSTADTVMAMPMGNPIRFFREGTGNPIVQSDTLTGSGQYFTLNAGGTMYWGDGSGFGNDLNLGRQSAGQMALGGSLGLFDSSNANGSILQVNGSAETGGRFIQIYHQTTTFYGDALQLNMGNNSGSLVGGNLINAIVSGSTVFKVDYLGRIFPVQAATVSAPPYIKGAIYFDTTLNKLRIGGASGWETVTSA